MNGVKIIWELKHEPLRKNICRDLKKQDEVIYLEGYLRNVQKWE